VQAVVDQILAGAVVEPNPLKNPVAPVPRRLLAALDLINLGYYNEAFVSAFALLDDVVQNVLTAALKSKGISERDGEQMLRAIERQRLKHYTCTLMPLLGWTSLEQADPELFRLLVGAKNSTNSVRNDIMHGDARLSRADAKKHIGVVLRSLDWLAKNPFGYAVDRWPALATVEAEFQAFPENEGSASGPK
jgi:hypothetical protein